MRGGVPMRRRVPVRRRAAGMCIAGVRVVVFNWVRVVMFNWVHVVVFNWVPAAHFAAVRSAVAIVVAVNIMAMLGFIATATVILASVAMINEAMLAPAVTITPAGPWTHAQKDTVVKVIRPVIALGGAAVRPNFVVAPMANGWFADFNGNLRANLWRYGQARKQCC